MQKLLLVGAGKWGQNFVKTIEKSDLVELCGVVDSKTKQEDINQMVAHGLDAIIVATPPKGREEVISKYLNYQVPILSEKPMTLSLSHTKNVITQSHRHNTYIVEDFIHLFNSPYQQMVKDLSKTEPIDITSEGGNTGPYRDYSPLFDYGPHDLSMILNIFKKYPLNLEVEKFNYQDELRFSVKVKMEFGDLGTAIASFGNTFPSKKRSFTLTNNKNQWVYDDLNTNKLTQNNTPIKILNQKSPLENALYAVTGIDCPYEQQHLEWLSINVAKLIEDINKHL